MIYEVEDGYVISDEGGWLPGVYTTREAAEYAFEFTATELHYINEMAVARGGDRNIIMSDLLGWRKARD